MGRNYCYKHIFFVTVSSNFPRWPGSGYSLGVTTCSKISDSRLSLTFRSLKNAQEIRAGDQDPPASEGKAGYSMANSERQIIIPNGIAMTILLEHHFLPRQGTGLADFCTFPFLVRLNIDTRMLFLQLYNIVCCCSQTLWLEHLTLDMH